MKQLRLLMALLLGALLLAACSGEQASLSSRDASLTATLPSSIAWSGQGSDSLECEKLGESPQRTADGWIHWIITQASGVTEAELELSGSGSGTFQPTKYGPVVEFFTPYFDVAELVATLHFAGTLAETSQFVISDYCPGVDERVEKLTVSKDAHTTFTREHDWSIDKSVNPTTLYLNQDGSGDGKATWTIDVTYEGYEDSGFNVSGEITIENTGDLDAVITAVDDVLAGSPIAVDCGVTFPYALPVGETLTCTYSADGYVEGLNEATVTTERDTYFDDAEIVWGAPTNEVNKTVSIKDVSDLFGEVDLGTATEPTGAQFTYDRDFAWQDFGAEECDSRRTYDNTVSLIGDDDVVLDEASATLIVKVMCDESETDVLRVSKSAHTSYAREHRWDLHKSVDKSHVTLTSDGSGDRTVTWTLDVKYLDAIDTSFTIFGEIEIENISARTPRSITSVMDDVGVAGVAPFAVECELDGAAVALPLSLEPGETLVCAYSVGVTGNVTVQSTGTNTATVTALGEDAPLTATAGWSFGAPAVEKNATVYLWDYSDVNHKWLFLGQFDAPNGGEVTYQNHFAWEDFVGKCRDSRSYWNWAKLFPDRHPQSFTREAALASGVASVYVKFATSTCE